MANVLFAQNAVLSQKEQSVSSDGIKSVVTAGKKNMWKNAGKCIPIPKYFTFPGSNH